MNSAGKMYSLIFCFILPAMTAPAGTGLFQPDFPPVDWSIDLRLSFSEDLCCKIMDVNELKRTNHYEWDGIAFELDHDGTLEVSLNHPFITGKIPENYWGQELPVAYMPQKDLASSYHQAFEIAGTFAFENKYRASLVEISGVDMDFGLRINGRSMYLSFGTMETIESLPPRNYPTAFPFPKKSAFRV